MEADAAQQLDDLRLDIATLQTLIDAFLDRGAGGEDLLLRACAATLQDRRHRLQQLVNGRQQPT